ncbi:hypothetical protein BJP37_15925 [Moorena bouillonii PNG]|uniref:Uncharacterized protein n=1 Tax=Moorena bouillonii PNG TaxID=568701 RepID=A0A1U7N2X0_9CYAN|nr:hypothetical protein BJP37_15925 [Moorena bouillonii PNG]
MGDFHPLIIRLDRFITITYCLDLIKLAELEFFPIGLSVLVVSNNYEIVGRSKLLVLLNLLV